MYNKIQNEINQAQKIGLKFETFSIEKNKKEHYFVQTTQKNVALAEAIISNMSQYKKASDVNCVEKPKQEIKSGSTAYWCSLLKEMKDKNVREVESHNKENLDENGNVKKFSYENLIENVVHSIDRENRTHQGVADGYNSVKDKIVQEAKNVSELIKILSDEDDGFKFAWKIRHLKGRRPYSFSSKFCHYMALYLLDGEEQDFYPIYDYVVFGVVKEYIKLEEGYQSINGNDVLVKNLSIDCEDDKTYNSDEDVYLKYRKVIDNIIRINELKENGQDISRNGFDHLIWLTGK